MKRARERIARGSTYADRIMSCLKRRFYCQKMSARQLSCQHTISYFIEGRREIKTGTLQLAQNALKMAQTRTNVCMYVATISWGTHLNIKIYILINKEGSMKGRSFSIRTYHSIHSRMRMFSKVFWVWSLQEKVLLLKENVWYVHPFIKILMNKLSTLQTMSHLYLVLQLSFLSVYMIFAGSPVNPFPGSRAVYALI